MDGPWPTPQALTVAHCTCSENVSYQSNNYDMYEVKLIDVDMSIL